jgi:hypothetical protein
LLGDFRNSNRFRVASIAGVVAIVDHQTLRSALPDSFEILQRGAAGHELEVEEDASLKRKRRESLHSGAAL